MAIVGPTIRDAIKMYIEEDLSMFEGLSHAAQLHRDSHNPPTYMSLINNVIKRMNHLFTGGRWCYHCDHFIHFEFQIDRYSAVPQMQCCSQNTNAFRLELNDYQKRGVDVVYVPVTWSFYGDGDTGTAHATLLIFYTKTKKYAHFDPTSGNMRIVHTANPLTYQVLNLNDLVLTHQNRYGALVTGYTAIDGRPRNQINNLQTDVERQDTAMLSKNPGRIPVMRNGLCALLSFFVLLCCRRFAYHDPWTVAEEIRALFMSKNITRKENFRKRLGLLFMKTHRLRDWSDLLEHFAFVKPPGNIQGGRQCLVRTARNGFCRRKPCHDQAFCNQHRFIMLKERWTRCKRCNCALPLHRLGPMGSTVSLI